MLYVFLFLLLFPLSQAGAKWLELDKMDANPGRLNMGYAAFYVFGIVLLTTLTVLGYV